MEIPVHLTFLIYGTPLKGEERRGERRGEEMRKESRARA